MGYQNQMIAGFSWHVLLKISATILAIIKIAIVARLLSPTDFGLFALVAITLGITEALTQTGINVTIIQSDKPITYFLDTAWIIAIIRGFLISILMILLGWMMTYFYTEPLLLSLVLIASFIPIIKGFINPSIIELHKNLLFFKDSLYRFSLVLVETLLAIFLAWIYGSVFALVIALIGGAIFEVCISFLFFKHAPALKFIKKRAFEIFYNAKSLNLTAVLSYLNENVDDFILGKSLGTYNLGLYHNAYALAHKPNYTIASASVHSTLPVYTKIASDQNRLRKAFLKSTSLTMSLVILATLPIFFFPDLIVNLFLGEQWLTIIPVLPWLAGAGIVQSFSYCLYALFLATKDYQPMNLHLLISVIIMSSLLIIFAPIWGVIGAGFAIFLTRVLSLPIVIIGARKHIKKIPELSS